MCELAVARRRDGRREKRDAPIAIDTHATMLCGQGARPGEGADVVATVVGDTVNGSQYTHLVKER